MGSGHVEGNLNVARLWFCYVCKEKPDRFVTKLLMMFLSFQAFFVVVLINTFQFFQTSAVYLWLQEQLDPLDSGPT